MSKRPPQLIALYSSVMQSGKSQVANTLVATHGFKLVKFADPIKDIIGGLLRKGGATEALIERMLEGDLKEEMIPALGTSVRRMSQTLGDWGRSINPDFWVNIADPRIRAYAAEGFDVVVDDMRYPNEYERVLTLGGDPVWVNRPGAKPYLAHSSEGQLEGYPMSIFHNNADLAQLRLDAERLPGLLRG